MRLLIARWVKQQRILTNQSTPTPGNLHQKIQERLTHRPRATHQYVVAPRAQFQCKFDPVQKCRTVQPDPGKLVNAAQLHLQLLQLLLVGINRYACIQRLVQAGIYLHRPQPQCPGRLAGQPQQQQHVAEQPCSSGTKPAFSIHGTKHPKYLCSSAALVIFITVSYMVKSNFTSIFYN